MLDNLVVQCVKGNMGLEQSVMNEAFLRIKEWNLQCPHRFLDIGCIQVKPCPWNLYSLTLISVPDIWVGAPEQDALYEALCSLRSIHDILRYEFHSDLHIPPTVIKEEIYPASADSSEQITPKNDGSDNLAKAAGDPSTSKEGDNLFEYWHPALQQLHIELNKPNRSLHCLNVEKPSSFRVTATRYSANRAFTSQDVARVAGDALYERYSIAVRMKNYDVNVRVLMFGLDRILVAHQLTSESLSRRHKEVYVNHVTTRSNIAYVIYAQASIQPGNKVLDPFCGSATILLEALSASRNAIECHGVDYSPKAIRGASNNASIEGVEKYCTFYKGDGRTLHKLFEPNTFDAIITNPPWGVRSGQSTDLEQLYAIFLQEAARVIKPGYKSATVLLIIVFSLFCICICPPIQCFHSLNIYLRPSETIANCHNMLIYWFFLRH